MWEGLTRRRAVIEDVEVKRNSSQALFQVNTWEREPQYEVGVPVTCVDVAQLRVRNRTIYAVMRREYKTAESPNKCGLRAAVPDFFQGLRHLSCPST